MLNLEQNTVIGITFFFLMMVVLLGDYFDEILERKLKTSAYHRRVRRH